MAEINWDEIKNALLETLKKESIDFVAGHAEQAAILGAETVKAILQSAMIDAIPIPEISSSLSDSQLAEVEKILARRDQLAQLISKAELENSQRVQQVRIDALNTASKIGMMLLGTGLGILTKL
jgi:PIN domain nuclease of toxin-antitoxin system